jgi:hypothetical protein
MPGIPWFTCTTETFRSATSFAGDWGLVGALNELADGDQPTSRHSPSGPAALEYSPFDLLHGGWGGGAGWERYLGFLVERSSAGGRGVRTRPGALTVIAGRRWVV